MDLTAIVQANTDQTSMLRAALTPLANALVGEVPRLHPPVPTYEGHTDTKSVEDVLQELAGYHNAEGLTEADVLQRCFP